MRGLSAARSRRRVTCTRPPRRIEWTALCDSVSRRCSIAQESQLLITSNHTCPSATTPPEYSLVTNFSEGLLDGRLTCEEQVSQELAQIRSYNKRLNAFITIFDDPDGPSLERARRLDAGLSRGGTTTKRKEDHPQASSRPLYGIPVSVKDNIFMSGFPTTNGSHTFDGFIPARNAEIVDRLLDAGCIPVGKANLHEFALGVTASSGYDGPIRNPLDPSRISGGSSGGSAVSVALSRGAMLSVGSDTGGSVRIPAALCGICGFKPSQGLLSTAGVFPLSATLDHLGIFAKTMPDTSFFFDAISGRGRASSDSRKAARSRERRASRRDAPPRRPGAGRSRLHPMRLGVPASYFTDDMDAAVSKGFWRALDAVSNAGSDVRPVEIVRDIEIDAAEFARYSRARANIMFREGGWFYERILRSPEERGRVHSDVLALLDRGLKMGELEYMYCLNVRNLAIHSGTRLFKGVDALLMPTCLIVAPRLEDIQGKETGQIRSLLLRNTEFFNTCGFPALSVPTNADQMSPSSLPTSIQVIGMFGEDDLVMEVGERLWDALYPRRSTPVR